MIKALRLSKFTKALMGLVILTLIVSLCSAASSLEELLNTPGVAEQMQASNGGKSTSGTEQDTPLVKQAREFALRINPPPPPQPVVRNPSPGSSQPIRPQAVVTAKFKLIGTSYHFGDESQSWALIDEVGKGLHWVRQGSKVGYLDVEKVGDGGVLINDNGRRYELLAERQDKPDLVKSYTGSAFDDKPIVLLGASETLTGQAESIEPAPEPIPEETPQLVVAPELSAEEQLKHAQENIEWLKQLQQDSNSAGLTEDEANELSGLGELLQSLESQAQDLQEVKTDVNSPPQPPAEEKPQEIVTNEQPKQPTPQPREIPQRPSDPVKLRRIRERK